jgi:hypothetical protein
MRVLQDKYAIELVQRRTARWAQQIPQHFQLHNNAGPAELATWESRRELAGLTLMYKMVMDCGSHYLFGLL